MLETILWPQFLAWIEYYQVDPFGSERGDMQAAVIASAAANVERTLVNVNIDQSKSRPLDRVTPKDFLLEFGKGDNKDTKGRASSTDRPRGRRILTAEAWQRVVNQAKDTAEINNATRRTRDRVTGEIKYE